MSVLRINDWFVCLALFRTYFIDDIYPQELEIKDTTDAPKWANYLDLHMEFDEDGTLFTRLYDKRDESDIPIVNFTY